MTEQKKKLLKAKIAVALHNELGRVPKTEEIDQVFLMARVMYKAVLGLQSETIDESLVWILPNPSGLNAHYRPGDLAKMFRELRETVEKN